MFSPYADPFFLNLKEDHKKKILFGPPFFILWLAFSRHLHAGKYWLSTYSLYVPFQFVQILFLVAHTQEWKRQVRGKKGKKSFKTKTQTLVSFSGHPGKGQTCSMYYRWERLVIRLCDALIWLRPWGAALEQ